MLKFGKKVNYRPMILSILVALTIGLLFGLNISRQLGWALGIIMFLVMFVGHYLIVLPIIFSYWDSVDETIHYSDINQLYKRLFSMFLPKFSPIRTVTKNQIKRINITGLPQCDTSLASDLVVSEEGGFMYNLLLMINDPVIVKLTTKNNQVISLNLSHDYVDHPVQTLGKLRIFLHEFKPSIINLSEATKDVLKY